LNFQKWVSIVSGVRYEYSDNYYQGKWSSIAGRGNNISGSIKDTSITKSYGHLLPDVHVKITPVKWMNARLSYARTLKRPNYNQVVPTTRVDLDQARLRDLGNGNLNEIIADSYDASISFYTGKFGLFSFGVFSKVFTDYITYSSYVIPPSVALEMGLSDNTFEILDLPVNLPEKGYVKGFEVDFQTNFRYLPKPFNGLILNFNLTRLQSLTQLEKWEKIEYYDPAVRRVVIDFDSSYFYKEKSKLTSQIDMVMNMTLGYEYRGFSFRMSLQYQGLDLINTLNSLETELSQKYNNPWLRMDLAISQEIGKHIKLRFNAANISQQSEKSYIYESHYWLDESRYGAVYQFGLEYNF